MGRLFWKFFLFIWLVQVAGVVGTGAIFWLERKGFEAQLNERGQRPSRSLAHEAFARQALLPGGIIDRQAPGGRPPPPPGLDHGHLPILPLLAGLIASLFCAAGLAWYFAKPIRHLREAFDRVAEGDLDIRVGPGMNGRRDELADLGNDFDRMTARLQTLISGQTRLLHDVSHELRSPLARLQAAIGLVRQQPGRLEDSLSRIEREGERMNRLVGELLTLSRVEAGFLGQLETVDIGELLAGIVDDARFEGGPKRLSIDYLPGSSAALKANPELLHRAIENVVRNALRYSPEGGVVSIHTRHVGHSEFMISIADAGPGVADSALEKIFDPFFRIEGNIEPGYGLGLAIARRVITAVNGKIEAKNRLEGGLQIDIMLPVSAAAVV